MIGKRRGGGEGERRESKVNVKQIVGMVLLLFGLLALTNVIALPMATVHVVGVAPTIYGVGLKGN